MKSNINFPYLIFLSVVAALGGFLFGYDAAVISGTVSQVASQFQLEEIQVGWFVGCALVGSIVGVLFAGKLSDKWGRKVTMLVAAIFFSVSGIGCATLSLICTFSFGMSVVNWYCRAEKNSTIPNTVFSAHANNCTLKLFLYLIL